MGLHDSGLAFDQLDDGLSGAPSRVQASSTSSPGFSFFSRALKPPRLRTAPPPRGVRTSPAFMPALSAGEPGTTPSSRRPLPWNAKSGTAPTDTRRDSPPGCGPLPAAAVRPGIVTVSALSVDAR